MLIFSLLFYAAGEPIYVFLLIGMAFADWILALFIERQPPKSNAAKTGVVLMCIINLGLLGVFKYGTFFLKNVYGIFNITSPLPKILLPIGISFYTFQLISYVVDVYRGEVKAQRDFPTLLLYVSLFHQCIAGPIVRYSDVAAQLKDRHVSADDLSKGVWRFSVGLAKKAVLANTCAAAADALLAIDGSETALQFVKNAPTAQLWIGVMIYTLQIYLDFSAYSDMAIGMGRMIGIRYLENFNYPYIANSITDFWRRWHISLSLFFRDYVYIPLGGNRNGASRTILNLLIVWCLTGFWHGASWNFLLWGFYYFVFLIFEKFVLRNILDKIWGFVRHIYVLLIVILGWIIFRYTDFNVGLNVFAGLLGLNGNRFWSDGTLAILAPYLLIVIYSVFAVTPVFSKLGRLFRKIAVNNSVCLTVYSVCRVAIPVLLLLLSTATLVGNSYNPFMYFRF